ncbi:hypothetical protein NVV95_11395 [Herbiconiux sp. CPCC 205716]|uniref:Uncharacterized protein n=1 Tax=Herbiconiux gentiana TaxID=2970912 RepID=A0ABT2GIQ7_9MICO|nr:hypothetical protein [Herbiconiux gentiana]MCS5715155.1 hypothetical protein [Herbiconiux gentiana]
MPEDRAPRDPQLPGREPTAASALDGFRLLPRRKLPVIPPKGEPWGGLLRPATLVWLAIGIVLVVAVVVGLTTSRSSAPTTLEGATAEVTGQADELTATLPEPPVAVQDDSAVEPCVDGGDRRQYALQRVLTLAPGFDAAAWAAELEDAYRAKDWNVVTDTAGDDGVTSIRLIGLNLVPLTARIAPTADGSTVTLSSISRCAAADGPADPA